VEIKDSIGFVADKVIETRGGGTVHQEFIS
jgi:hypothetical protein